MKLSLIRDILNAEVLSGESHLEDEVYSGFGCDLMSDVLCYAREDAVLLTGLVNKQVLNTADMANMNSIIFVRSKVPSEEVIQMAKEMNILVMTTKYILFESCGLLYQNGLIGAHIR
ncbi:DRTGG domain-containing protein [Acetobacterium bakii]|uniref:DRTGG domain-containing protein n=1 Tax=Acetobacterium bakii TaxID=52689 RepID=A0A0L6U2D4_9FIRM|nr:DRTGG domain-containing protein [Acetobacterium bakii]KNZ42502.1 DRTGG domain-containing protein [Acetobacterium bakii]